MSFRSDLVVDFWLLSGKIVPVFSVTVPDTDLVILIHYHIVAVDPFDGQLLGGGAHIHPLFKENKIDVIEKNETNCTFLIFVPLPFCALRNRGYD